MSYYHYMVSVYRSCLPQLNRTLRSSSVSRTLPDFEPAESAPSRFVRATTVGPTSYEYVSAMPFTYQYQQSTQKCNDSRSKLSFSDPSRFDVYHRAFSTKSSRDYDYKVVDYASRLDQEEATRDYINRRKVELTYAGSESGTSLRQRYDYYSPMKHERDYMYDTRDIGTYRHYRLSNQTLSSRNDRAKSPLLSRELNRYYKTERRSSYIGDISSGANRDFRYYSYRPVPYFGGSDQYAMTKKRPQK